MLKTQFGNIVITFDGESVPFSIIPIANEHLFPDVNGAFMLKYVYACDDKAHTLHCFLDACNVTGYPESGERLEAIAFYEQGGKLTIGCEGWFGEPEEYGYDYDGSYLSNGLEIVITSHTKSKDFLFGVSWLDHCTDENEVQTWFAVDPTIVNV